MEGKGKPKLPISATSYPIEEILPLHFSYIRWHNPSCKYATQLVHVLDQALNKPLCGAKIKGRVHPAAKPNYSHFCYTCRKSIGRLTQSKKEKTMDSSTLPPSPTATLLLLQEKGVISFIPEKGIGLVLQCPSKPRALWALTIPQAHQLLSELSTLITNLTLKEITHD